MTRRRWIADEVQGNHATLTGEHAAHLSRVLRAKAGQQFDVATPTAVRVGKIISVSDDRIEFELGEEVPTIQFVDVTLVLSIFKFDLMEWALEKCVELGATRIIPLIAHRTEPHLASAATKRRERWQRLALQASEQCRRTTSPEIAEPIKLKDILSQGTGARIVLNESETATMLADALPPAADAMMLAIGPEGGWTPAELKLFQEAGWTSASLGPTILRAETAAIAATAIALSVLQ